MEDPIENVQGPLLLIDCQFYGGARLSIVVVRALYVDLNSFFASCEQQDHPALRGRPVAVVPLLADSTAVIAASYEAKAFGIKTGTKVGEAKRLCPNLQLVEARHGRYVHFHNLVIAAVDSVIPVHAVRSIDEIAVELTGTQRTEERAREIAQKIKVALRTSVGESLTCSIGIAPNFLLAKIACDMQKPDGLTVLRKQDLPASLYSLQLQDIPGIGPRMFERLRAKGIQSLQSLMPLPQETWRGIWGGIWGARMHLLMNGEWLDFAAGKAAQSIGHEHVLPPKDRNRKGALAVAQRLLSKASLRLRQGQFMARKFSLDIKYLDGDKFHRELRFEEAQDNAFFMKILEKAYAPCPALKRPVKVRITLSDFIFASQHQLSLFSTERNIKAQEAMDAINKKFGRDTIYVGSLHDNLDKAPTRIAFSRIPGLDEVD
jgi:DNA polymerase-4